MKKLLSLIILLLVNNNLLFSQIISNSTGSTSNPKRILYFSPIQKGIMIQEFDTNQLYGLSPTSGFVMYNTSTNKFEYYNSSISRQLNPRFTKLPIVSTHIVSEIKATQAISGGTITSDSGSKITARGICWSSHANPTIADSITSDSIGVGNFFSRMTRLKGNTTYFVRAYATNGKGTGYGNEISFKTPSYNLISVYSGDSVTLKIQEYYNRGGVEWQESIDTIHWTTIPGAVNDTYQFLPSQTQYYRAIIYTSAFESQPSAIKLVDLGSLLNPELWNVTAFNPQYRTLLIDSENTIWSTSGKSFRYSGKLFKSYDFENYTEVLSLGQPNKLEGVFELSDGELLLVSTIQANSNLDNCGVFKTTNNRTGKIQVIKPRNTNLRFVSNWGISVAGTKVLIAEYGSFAGLDGSRYLYLSDDNANTFSPVLDLMNAPVGFFPTSNGWEEAHIHCCTYDAVWDRLWVSTGDGINSKTLAWSDDYGVSWESLNLNNYFGDGVKYQFISMGVTATGLILGTDNAMGGIVKILRTSKEETPVLTKIYSDGINEISHLTGIMRIFNQGEPLVIPVGRGDHEPLNPDYRHSYVMAYDGNKLWKMWQDAEESAYPMEMLMIHRLSKDKLVLELDNTMFSTDRNSATPSVKYTACRYIADFPKFDISRLNAPTGLVASFLTDVISGKLEWVDNEKGTSEYEIYSSTNGAKAVLIATTAAGATSYQDTACKQNASVQYRIRAKKGTVYSDYVTANKLSIP